VSDVVSADAVSDVVRKVVRTLVNA
jgi:hypothetical protein